MMTLKSYLKELELKKRELSKSVRNFILKSWSITDGYVKMPNDLFEKSHCCYSRNAE